MGTALPFGGTPLLDAPDPFLSPASYLSLEKDELATSIQRSSITETKLRLVKRDRTRMPGLLVEKSEDPPAERQSFKWRTGPTLRSGNNFPAMPLDRVCSDRIEGNMLATIWNTYSKWAETYYRFPTVDFDIYFPNPVLPDSASDRLAADRGTAPSKFPFADKAHGKMEEVVGKRDSASRFGMRTSSFRLLLSEYLTLAGVEDSAVPADMLVASIHCLTAGCIPIWTSLQGF